MQSPPQKEQSITLDHSFSILSLGITIGAIGALLLGTKEGRKIAHDILDTINESGLTEKFVDKSKEVISKTSSQIKEEIKDRYPHLTPPRLPPV